MTLLNLEKKLLLDAHVNILNQERTQKKNQRCRYFCRNGAKFLKCGEACKFQITIIHL